MNPRLLVVTPTLGVSRHLDATVASVAAQPLRIAHVLSAPASRIVDLRQRYPNAFVIRDGGPVGGIYGALNAALLQDQPPWDWFTYINDDDVLQPGFTAVARRHFARPNPEPVTYGRVEQIDEDGVHTGFVTTERNPRRFGALLQQGISPLMQQGMLFRRDCVERLSGFDPSYRLCADLDFWLRASTGGWRFRFYPAVVASFRLRAGQLSGDTQRTLREQREIVSRLFSRRLPAWRLRLARWQYRLANLPLYLERIRRHGLVTSYEMLEQAR
ncbi:MAG TPA: glycosyltransferase [Candidatus Didemnitutus sp.]|nr:glycosyltransferase [Candidatus Didemnitutus sp.]